MYYLFLELPPLPPGSRNICPQIMCPNQRKIKEFCNKPEFVIGRDGQTRCRVCDSNLCGEYSLEKCAKCLSKHSRTSIRIVAFNNKSILFIFIN